MKIKVVLMTEDDRRKAIEEFVRQNPEIPQGIETTLNSDSAFIELDTGGEFDDLPAENRKNLQNATAAYLKSFGCKLMAAMIFDFAARLRGDKTIGMEAIETGLEEMERGLRIANPGMVISVASRKISKQDYS